MAKSVESAPSSKGKRRAWLPLLLLLAVSVFMYVSIMYKIVHYGP